MKQAKSPLRVDFTGGFLDLPPVYHLIKNCLTFNGSIPVFTGVKINFKPSLKKNIAVKIHFLNQAFSYTEGSVSSLLKTKNQNLCLLKKHLEYWTHKHKPLTAIFNKGCEISLYSESPLGGGLGASSALNVCLAKVFSKLSQKAMSKKQTLLLAQSLETAVLHAPAGVQDYIPALHPKQIGVLYKIFYVPGEAAPRWEAKKIPPRFLKDHTLLVHTGISHNSGQSNWEILKKLIHKDMQTLTAVQKLRDLAMRFNRLIWEGNNWHAAAQMLNTEQRLKTNFFPYWNNPAVYRIEQALRDQGAKAVKLCGAGGGGTAVVLTKSKLKKQKLKYFCLKHKLKIIWS